MILDEIAGFVADHPALVVMSVVASPFAIAITLHLCGFRTPASQTRDNTSKLCDKVDALTERVDAILKEMRDER